MVSGGVIEGFYNGVSKYMVLLLLARPALKHDGLLLQYLAVRLFGSAVLPGRRRWQRRPLHHGTGFCGTLGLSWRLIDEAHLKVHGTMQSHLEAGFFEKAIRGTCPSGAKVILVQSHCQFLSNLLTVIPLRLKLQKHANKKQFEWICSINDSIQVSYCTHKTHWNKSKQAYCQ